MKKETLQNKNYTTAPLPFMGQKRNFLKDFKEVLNSEFQDRITFVDLFGGSGLLSHTAKSEKPNSRVIYNDYDNYSQRIANIDRTNTILQELRILLQGCVEDKKLPTEMKDKVLRLFKRHEKSGFIDYITLSSSLLFSMNYATNYDEMSKQTLYSKLKKGNYCADGYLAGVEVVSCDYRVLFEKYKHDGDVVFFVDPPYLSTETGVYKSYWRLKDYLDVLKVLESNSFIYFTSHKSNIIELCDWIEENLHAQNPFANTGRKEFTRHLSRAGSYQDIMLYKRQVKQFLNVA